MAQIKSKTRLVFLLFNLLYFGMGAGMFGVGLYNIFSLQSFEDFGEPVYITGGVLFAMLGIAKVALAVLGILAMAMEWKIPLVIYFVLSGFLILPTLAAGIFGLQQWYFVFEQVGTNMEAIYNDSMLFDQTETLRLQFRQDFNCCGIMEGLPTDYTQFGREEPPAPNCTTASDIRTSTPDQPQQTGCQFYITAAIRSHLYYIGAIGLAFGFFELTAALVAMQNMEGL